MKKIIQLLILSTFLAHFTALSESEIKFDSGKEPFETLPIEIQEKNKDDKFTIRFYFSYTCPYCKQSHDFINTWGNSLPKQYSFIQSHVISTTNTSMMLTGAHEFTEFTSKNKANKDKFRKLIYKHIHKINNDQQLSRLIKEALDGAKFDTQMFFKVIGSKDFKDKTTKNLIKQNDYDIQVTPTVVIGGKYVTHLGLAGGDTTQFIEIINAVTNMYMQEVGIFH